MYDQQITYLSSNQRRTHTVHFLCCFAVKKIKQHKSVGVLIVCHFRICPGGEIVCPPELSKVAVWLSW